VTYLSDGALNVSDDGSVRVIEKLDTDLSHVTGVSGASEDTVNLSKFHGLIHIYLLNIKVKLGSILPLSRKTQLHNSRLVFVYELQASFLMRNLGLNFNEKMKHQTVSLSPTTQNVIERSAADRLKNIKRQDFCCPLTVSFFIIPFFIIQRAMYQRIHGYELLKSIAREMFMFKHIAHQSNVTPDA
jgi:hypothetical protein